MYHRLFNPNKPFLSGTVYRGGRLHGFPSNQNSIEGDVRAGKYQQGRALNPERKTFLQYTIHTDLIQIFREVISLEEVALPTVHEFNDKRNCS